MADQNDIIILPDQRNHPGNIRIADTIGYAATRMANRNQLDPESRHIYDYVMWTGRRFIQEVHEFVGLLDGEDVRRRNWREVDDPHARPWVRNKLHRECRRIGLPF